MKDTKQPNLTTACSFAYWNIISGGSYAWELIWLWIAYDIIMDYVFIKKKWL